MNKFIEKYKSHIGNKFNSLTILELSDVKKNNRYLYVCKCDCGNIQTIRADRVINNITKTCGCRNKNYSYGYPTRLSCLYPNLYSVWNTMLKRCYNPNCNKYKNYGARNITVCNEWKHSFKTFLDWALNNGYIKGLTLDRINVNGNYNPKNCRWVDYKTQARNKTNNKLITYQNQTKSIAQWCDDLKLPYNTTRARIRLGWNTELAFTTPISKSNKRKKLII